MTRRAFGLRAWLWQRVSAVYLLAYLLIGGGMLLRSPPAGYAEWHDWMAEPFVGLATALFFAALLLHAWIGVRDIIIDYVGSLAARLTLLTLTGFGLAGAGLWTLKILYSLHAS